jgi:hypothetical protein
MHLVVLHSVKFYQVGDEVAITSRRETESRKLSNKRGEIHSLIAKAAML